MLPVTKPIDDRTHRRWRIRSWSSTCRLKFIACRPRPPGSTGQNARTLIKYDDFRVVLIALAGEARMREHKSEGRISIHVLSGHIQLRAGRSTFAQAGCLRSTMASLTMSTHSKRAPFSSRLPGQEEHDVLGDSIVRTNTALGIETSLV